MRNHFSVESNHYSTYKYDCRVSKISLQKYLVSCSWIFLRVNNEIILWHNSLNQNFSVTLRTTLDFHLEIFVALSKWCVDISKSIGRISWYHLSSLSEVCLKRKTKTLFEIHNWSLNDRYCQWTEFPVFLAVRAWTALYY